MTREKSRIPDLRSVWDPNSSASAGHTGLVPLEEQFPDIGTVAVEWTVTEINGQRRLSWTFRSVPQLDPKLAIALLRDVATELEIDLPE